MAFSISEAKTLFASIAELYKKGANLDAEQKLIELREAVLELQTENLEFKEKINKMEKQLSVRDSLNYDGRFYWSLPKVGEKEGPYCQLCQDSSEKLIRLQKRTDEHSGNYWYRCLNCGNNFDKD
jgi:DNA-directed RNA polymerase subunit M/transcription elongation factor TFIIS